MAETLDRRFRFLRMPLERVELSALRTVEDILDRRFFDSPGSVRNAKREAFEQRDEEDAVVDTLVSNLHALGAAGMADPEVLSEVPAQEATVTHINSPPRVRDLGELAAREAAVPRHPSNVHMAG